MKNLQFSCEIAMTNLIQHLLQQCIDVYLGPKIIIIIIESVDSISRDGLDMPYM